ncbi:hypothetical protein TH63_05410 [Rufibacter radiotolerans]|uniref:Uncharacterized protein n=1 Tax=Rufibacter radiotolerans TaxID=1379910 RepID=A0A0H4VHM0_9BACT|nr:hypothetical protein [Rufibacter radiotolerans]AKQ45195.1 hypothetical protein TH63_05410 [Rufibacter radiotolerans]
MIDFLRSLFGGKDEAGERMVVGAPVDFGLRDVAYIKDSNLRLTQLQDLTARYHGTPHEAKLKAVYEKTRQIHAYLVSRKRVHDLEIFHLQNTDHFVSAYTAIIDVHHRPADTEKEMAELALKGKPDRPIRLKRSEKLAALPDLVKPIQTSVQKYDSGEARAVVPRLYVPDISINTFEKITYYTEDKAGNLVPNQVGFTSSKAEKEAFQQYMAATLGLEDASYVGNTLVTIPNSNGITPTGLVPVLHWESFLYAVNLNDMRLFPVRIYRKGV